MSHAQMKMWRNISFHAISYQEECYVLLFQIRFARLVKDTLQLIHEIVKFKNQEMLTKNSVARRKRNVVFFCKNAWCRHE
jgi:hypothetical protein